MEPGKSEEPVSVDGSSRPATFINVTLSVCGRIYLCFRTISIKLGVTVRAG